MGLTYHYRFEAPAKTAASELETFLRGVERAAKRLGFGPTLVLNARFDTFERREFARRLTTGHLLESERLKGAVVIEPGQAWNHDCDEGECRLLPEQGVVLVLSEDGCETVFGFFRYPAALRDLNGRAFLDTGLGETWLFRDHLKSGDPRFRQIVKMFREAGYVEEENDEFAAASH
jgi:hypothetical protein